MLTWSWSYFAAAAAHEVSQTGQLTQPLKFTREVNDVKGKVKCTLVQALRLCTGRTAHRGSRGIALLFHDHGSRRGWGVSVTLRPHFTSGKNPVPIVQEAGWAPGPARTGAENLAPNRIGSPNCAAHSQSLYRLRYPTHQLYMIAFKNSAWRWLHRNEPKHVAVRYDVKYFWIIIA